VLFEGYRPHSLIVACPCPAWKPACGVRARAEPSVSRSAPPRETIGKTLMRGTHENSG
jgi:hypothetical protein